jgi:hypothetical protein
MAIDFHAPSYRAASGDLTISVSPLGLVELADEEFEVHGPRMNRYATNWAWYLGSHWSYRKPQVGDNLLTFNYVRAFQDYITNFTFGKGVAWRTPKATEAIVPGILKRVWEEDNDKEQLLAELGQQGGVTGDCFVKVAYEPAWVDPAGGLHEGRCRIIPLNATHCFPEFAPHDRSRMLRFKLKYRFWGTSLEGTRQVFTYTEIMTDNAIEEYINDEMIDSRPNALGVIPIVHIANLPVASSPWGLSDTQDIVSLNREFNEKATEISDIINYYSAPVTVITGAKASQLERGPRKVWGGLPKDASVFNLEMETNLSGPLTYIELIKRAMHEMTGVPEGALGQSQPISNTSGVALSIQYQPLMNKYSQKKIQYSKGFRRINELVLRTLFVYEPESMVFNPGLSAPPESGQLMELDPRDQTVFQTSAHWPSPLPIDVLVKLNEEQAKLQLGIQSKRGMLRELGEEFPDEKMEEIFSDRLEDMKDEGALSMLQAKIDAAVQLETGLFSVDQSLPPELLQRSQPSAGKSADGTPMAPPPLPGPKVTPEVENMAAELAVTAYGTKLAQHRMPDADNDDS